MPNASPVFDFEMAVKKHIEQLKLGADAWKTWRLSESANVGDFNKAILVREKFLNYELDKAFFHRANLRGTWFVGSHLNLATFTHSNIMRCDFYKADLGGADFSHANAERANFRHANLRGANLQRGIFKKCDFSKADLSQANLKWGDFREANFEEANLQGSFLNYSMLIKANLRNANISDSHIYGISTWEIDLENAIQKNLVITPHKETTITVEKLLNHEIEMHALLNFLSFARIVGILPVRKRICRLKLTRS
jgi:uncharacterized protein YjbI with pentapeptide repeats